MYSELESTVKQICEIAEVEKVILYGVKHTVSGENIREVNFCVVVRGTPAEAEKKIYRELDIDMPYNLLIYDKESFERLSSDPTSYVSSILNKGVVLHG